MSEAQLPVEDTMVAAHEILDGQLTQKPGAINLNTLRIATQVRELVLQGVTIKNTFEAMESVWLDLHTADKKCLIVEMQATKVRAQLINLYGIKLIKYINSIVGLDLITLGQTVSPENLNFGSRDIADRNWKIDAVMLNIGSNRITSHLHLFKLVLVNIFGLAEHIVELSLNPTWAGLRAVVLSTYDIDLGDVEDVEGIPELELVDGALYNYLANPSLGYKPY